MSYPDNAGPYDIASVQSVLDGAISSLEKADKNHDGTLSDAELKKASKVAKSFVEFAAKYADKSVDVFKIKPYEKPGSAEWVALVKKEYFGGPNEPMNKPYFGTAMILKRNQLPNAKLQSAYDALVRDFPGTTVEATSRKVNGAIVYLMHAKADTKYNVREFDESGKQLAEGVAKQKPSDPRANWSVSWK